MIQYCQICDSHGLIGSPINNLHLIPIDTFVKSGSEFLDVPYRLVMSPLRRTRVCDARHMIMTYLNHYPKYTLMDIGRYFKRNHATIINAKVKVYSLSFTEPNFKQRYLSLVDHLNSIVN